MNTSSDLRGARTRGRVVRATRTSDTYATVQYEDLAGVTSATLDPSRIDAAIDAGYRDGHAQGHADGWAAGHADALRQAKETTAHMTAVLERLAAAANAVAEREAAILRSAEDVFAAAAFELAAAVIGRELELAESPGVDAIARALALAPVAGDVTVRLNPDDHDAVQVMHAATLDERVRLVPDPSLARGDAIAEWADTTLDARIGSAIERARRVLTGERAS